MEEQKHVLKKFNHSMIGDILQELELSEAQLSSLTKIAHDMSILNQLLEASEYEKAVKYLACGLPKRESIWWGFICSEEAEKHDDDPTVQQALAIVEDWVKEPTEEKRRSAKQLAEALEYYTPISWTAIAVFWSDGSISKPEAPVLDAEPLMCGEAVANAVVIAANKIAGDPDEAIQIFIKRGLHIAMGGNGRI